MMKGLILINAYSKIKSALDQAERLKEEFAALGVSVDIRRNDFFAAYVGNDGNLAYNSINYDFCVYLDKDKYVSEMLEKGGLRLFNSHGAIRRCDDKMETFIALSGMGIPMPKTLPGLLCYDKDAKVTPEILDRVEKEIGYPVIVKCSYGSLGKEIYKADDRQTLERIAEAVRFEQHLYQRFIAESAGRDIRVIVIGGKAFAAMVRRSENDFRSNLGAGGKGEKVDLPTEVKDISERAAKALGLDYCGIDVLFGDNGYILCEVNSNAFFGGIESVTGKNVAKAYAEYIVETMRNA